MTFLEQQNMLSELLGDPNTSTDDAFPLARRKAALNRGDIQFCTDSKCVKEYATGIVAADEIAMPSDCAEVFCLILDGDVVDDKREIDIHQWEEFKNNGCDEPYYYIWEYSGTKKMKFLANAGATGKTYELYYYKKQSTALSGDADVSIIPDEFCEAPVYYAAAWLLKQLGKLQLSAVYQNEYENFVGKGILKSEKESIKINRPNPETSSSVSRGGYNQGDGGYSA